MQHSIAARYAARPVARFVRPSVRLRERHLGLRPTVTFRPTGGAPTLLRQGRDGASPATLRGGTRRARPVPSNATAGRRLHAPSTMRWARSGRPLADRPSGAAPAPWHG